MLRCSKHPDQIYVISFMVSQPVEMPAIEMPPYCYLCFRDALTRIGVHAMFPEPEKPVEWPESLEEKK